MTATVADALPADDEATCLSRIPAADPVDLFGHARAAAVHPAVADLAADACSHRQGPHDVLVKGWLHLTCLTDLLHHLLVVAALP